MTDIDKFAEWSKDNPYCTITITIGGYSKKDAGNVRIFVYNSKLDVGQVVTSVDEIDINAEYEERMKQKKQEVEEYFKERDVM